MSTTLYRVATIFESEGQEKLAEQIRQIADSARLRAVPALQEMDAALRHTGTATSSLTSVDAALQGVRSTIRSVVLAAGGLFAIRAAFTVAADAEEAPIRLALAYRNVGLEVTKYQGAIDGLAEHLRSYGYTNEQTEAALARLTAITGDAGHSFKAMQVVADLAAAEQVSLEDAAVQVGRAMGGYTMQLERAGFITKGTDDVVASLRQHLGDMADQMQNTLRGALQTMTGEMSTLTERVALTVLGAANWREATGTVVTALKDAQRWVGEHREQIQLLVQQLVAVARETATFADRLTDALPSLQSFAIGLTGTVTLVEQVAALVRGATGELVAFYGWADKLALVGKSRTPAALAAADALIAQGRAMDHQATIDIDGLTAKYQAFYDRLVALGDEAAKKSLAHRGAELAGHWMAGLTGKAFTPEGADGAAGDDAALPPRTTYNRAEALQMQLEARISASNRAARQRLDTEFNQALLTRVAQVGAAIDASVQHWTQHAADAAGAIAGEATGYLERERLGISDVLDSMVHQWGTSVDTMGQATAGVLAPTVRTAILDDIAPLQALASASRASTDELRALDAWFRALPADIDAAASATERAALVQAQFDERRRRLGTELPSQEGPSSAPTSAAEGERRYQGAGRPGYEADRTLYLSHLEFLKTMATEFRDVTAQAWDGVGTAMSAGMTKAFQTGSLSKSLAAFGKTLMGGFGQMFTEHGKSLLAYGTIMVGLTPLLGNPFTSGPAALAAGVALIALGAAFNAVSQSGAAAGSAGGGSPGAFGTLTPQGYNAVSYILPGGGQPFAAGTPYPGALQPIVVNVIGAADPTIQSGLVRALTLAVGRGHKIPGIAG